jgi:hypothetical protein
VLSAASRGLQPEEAAQVEKNFEVLALSLISCVYLRARLIKQSFCVAASVAVQKFGEVAV